jgi:hypothetical protein
MKKNKKITILKRFVNSFVWYITRMENGRRKERL